MLRKQYYTYEDKNQRSIKFIAIDLHQTCERQDIMMDLQPKVFKVIDAVNIIKKKRKETNEVVG